MFTHMPAHMSVHMPICMVLQGGLGAGGTYREAWSGGVLGVPSGLVGAIYTQSNSDFTENP